MFKIISDICLSGKLRSICVARAPYPPSRTILIRDWSHKRRPNMKVVTFGAPTVISSPFTAAELRLMVFMLCHSCSSLASNASFVCHSCSSFASNANFVSQPFLLSSSQCGSDNPLLHFADMRDLYNIVHDHDIVPRILLGDRQTQVCI